MDTNFTPAVPLKFWTQKVLPLVYDDSISYLEFLGKVNYKLTELIENINEIQTFLENSEIDPETNATKDYVNHQLTASSAAINSTIQAVKTELQTAIANGDTALDTKINEVDSALQAKITEHYTVVQSQIDNVNVLITSTAEATLNSAKADATQKVNALGALAAQGRFSSTITDWNQCVQNGTYYVDLVRALGFASAPALDSSITTPTNGIAILKVHQSGDTTSENKSIQELDYFWIAEDKTNFKSWCRAGSYSGTTFTLEYGWLNTDIAGNVPVIPTDVATEEYVNRKIGEALTSYETEETAQARYEEIQGMLINTNNNVSDNDRDIAELQGDVATLQTDSFLPRTSTSDNFNLILTPGTYSFVMPTIITQDSWPSLDTSIYPAPSTQGFVTLNVYNAGDGGRITQTCTYSYLNSSQAINVSYTRVGVRSENGSLTVTYPWTESSYSPDNRATESTELNIMQVINKYMLISVSHDENVSLSFTILSNYDTNKTVFTVNIPKISGTLGYNGSSTRFANQTIYFQTTCTLHSPYALMIMLYSANGTDFINVTNWDAKTIEEQIVNKLKTYAGGGIIGYIYWSLYSNSTQNGSATCYVKGYGYISQSN